MLDVMGQIFQKIVLHTNRLKVEANYIPELGFFSPEMLGVIRGADNAPMQVIKGCLQYS